MKKRLLCPQLPRKGIPTILLDTEAHHAIRVLRLRDGDIIEALDGIGHSALTTLRTRGGQPRLEFIHSETSSNTGSQSPPFLAAPFPPLTLEIAALKGDAMEWVIEKSVELGVQCLSPILTDHTVVQMKNKSPEIFQERWQKIADQSLKQCGRLERMQIQTPIPLERLMTQTQENTAPSIRLWCDEAKSGESLFLPQWLNSRLHTSSDPLLIKILIGPEGGWSTQERLLLEQVTPLSPTLRMSLGPHVLRAETAALFAVSLVSAYRSQ